MAFCAAGWGGSAAGPTAGGGVPAAGGPGAGVQGPGAGPAHRPERVWAHQWRGAEWPGAPKVLVLGPLWPGLSWASGFLCLKRTRREAEVFDMFEVKKHFKISWICFCIQMNETVDFPFSYWMVKTLNPNFQLMVVLLRTKLRLIAEIV